MPESPTLCLVKDSEKLTEGLTQVLKEYEPLFSPKTNFLQNPKHGHQFEFTFKEGAKFSKANTMYSLNLQKKRSIVSICEKYVG